MNREVWEIIADNPQIYGESISMQHRFMVAGINIDHDDPVMKKILEEMQ